ncbi:hypothetical protein [Nevskia ramosa]|uniref:hypothetical protein n=1 Tax=Nevskia ramosa TaxID=64002 RepID=UPI0023571F50|nr:hypothetical protein [Nevskia ramosa]
MRINGRTIERLSANVESCNARIQLTRAKLLEAIAARAELAKVKKLGDELRRLNERRERWIAESMERQFTHLTAAFE